MNPGITILKVTLLSSVLKMEKGVKLFQNQHFAFSFRNFFRRKSFHKTLFSEKSTKINFFGGERYHHFFGEGDVLRQK